MEKNNAKQADAGVFHHFFRRKKLKTCRICRASFEGSAKYALFCGDCKRRSEIYRYADWLSH